MRLNVFKGAKLLPESAGHRAIAAQHRWHPGKQQWPPDAHQLFEGRSCLCGHAGDHNGVQRRNLFKKAQAPNRGESH
jgi:hypothetical protein